MNIRRYRVMGHVQGVGFRYFVWRAAEEIGVDGWVRNRADGTVEALASGTSHDLTRFQQRLEEGPRLSRVTFVAVAEEADEEVRGGFEIRRDGP